MRPLACFTALAAACEPCSLVVLPDFLAALAGLCGPAALSEPCTVARLEAYCWPAASIHQHVHLFKLVLDVSENVRYPVPTHYELVEPACSSRLPHRHSSTVPPATLTRTCMHYSMALAPCMCCSHTHRVSTSMYTSHVSA